MNCLTTKLYTYQLEAVEKLSKLKVGNLFMDMGTGKTITAIKLILDRLNKNKCKHVIWICPCNVKDTIKNEILKHTNVNNNNIYIFDNGTNSRNLPSCKWYIVGWESIGSSLRVYSALESIIAKSFLVADESHYIKNHDTVRFTRLLRNSFNSNYRLNLTGTAITHGIEDLWSQQAFLSYKILGYSTFRLFANIHIEYDIQQPSKVSKRKDADIIMAKIAPYTFQITKEECFDLPEKSYNDIEFNLTDEQREAYQYNKNSILDKYADSKITANKEVMIFKLFSTLRQISSGYYTDAKTDEYIDLFKSWGKNPRCQELYRTILNMPKTATVIIWCQYKYDIKTICNMLDSINESYSLLHGGIKQVDRPQQLADFDKSKNRFLIATTKTGGVGINLTQANYAVFYTNSFSYTERDQAESRNHRHGQVKNVHYINLIANCGIDKIMLNCLKYRRNGFEQFRNELKKLKDCKTEAEVKAKLKQIFKKA